MSRTRPLLHARLVRQRLENFPKPADFDARHERILRWVRMQKGGTLSTFNEVQLHGDFLALFSSVLGYPSPLDAQDGVWNLMAEKHVGGGGKTADGALGFFEKGAGSVVCPIELKGALQNLDAAGSRALTPVQQAWEYAHYSSDCRFIIVSNYKETRLYSRRHTPDEYERFLLEDLADPAEFHRFLFLLSRDNLIGPRPGSTSVVDELLVESSREEVEVTRKLYAEYRDIRQALYEHLKQRHSNQPDLDLLRYTQTVLDRVLFVAFAEDRGLLPSGTLEHAATYRHAFRKEPTWSNFVGLFDSINVGNDQAQIPRYNGGLFRADPEVDALDISDEMVARVASIGRYDFHDDVSVEVLGHIFEQSITDLEQLRAEATGSVEVALSKRKAEGVFYTPTFITRYLVEETLGRTFSERWKAVLGEHQPDAKRGVNQRTAAWVGAWEAYRDEIKRVRVLDPACGSGAFLVAAFDRLAREYERVNASLAELQKGQTGVFDLTKTILNENLYGVDLNRESIEITKLSLWLKTAMRNRPLTDLDRNIKWGNSVVDDVAVDPHAFDWRTGNTVAGLLDPPKSQDARDIDAHWRDGFDVVVGNPPYVRQELLGASKEHWKGRFQTYDGVADLFVYFFERGVQVLRDGGRLGFIVANKWFRAGYAEGLRQFLASETTVERIVDFGHAPIFEDADAFPSLITLKKKPPTDDTQVDVTLFPREQLGSITVEDYVETHQYPVPQARFGKAPWSLEPPQLDALMTKIRNAGPALVEYAGVKPYYGVKTGFNEAFLIDTRTRDRLVAEDPKSEEVIKKFLRGQDIGRWAPEWDGRWMIFTRRGIDIDRYPAIKRHLEGFRTQLEPRPKDWKGKTWPGRKPGRYKWFEIQDSVDYFEGFERPKIIYPDIAWSAQFCFDPEGHFLNNTGYFLNTSDLWLVVVLNSSLMWTYQWRHAQHAKDEALRMFADFVFSLPIARPTDAQRALAETNVPRLVELATADQRARAALADSLRLQFDVEKPGRKLLDPASLSADAFVKEAVKRRKTKTRLSAAGLGELKALHEEIARPMRARGAERLQLERALSDAVNDAYGLTPEEVELMWDTAPPRMPVGRG